MSPDLVIALTALLASVSCALTGVFLVLRRMAMLGDALSHAVLPGLVAGYFLAQGPNLFLGFLGALAAALLTAWLISWLKRTGRVSEDAATGIVFPAMFALGVLVVSRFFSNVHLDTDAVLYGEIALAPFDTLEIGSLDLGPVALWTLSLTTLLAAAFLVLFWKELKLTTFDPEQAELLGFRPRLMQGLLVGLVALNVVAALSAVGAILVVGLLVGPAATAALLTRRLLPMVIGSVGVGASVGLGGYGLAAWLDVSISGMIAAGVGVAFGVAALIQRRRAR